MNSLTIDPVFRSPLAILAIAIVLFAVPLLVPVMARGVTPSQRRTLQWLRIVSSVLLMLAILRPAILRTDSLNTEATVAVLLDRSRSMTMPADSSQSRSDVQNELFQRLRPAIAALDKSLVMKTILYDADARELIVNDETSTTLAEPPDGIATNISAAIDAAIQSSAGKPLAGVILMGDGVEVLPPADRENQRGRDSQAGARTLAGLDVPLWTVPIGPPGDLGQVRDLEVDGLAESFGLFSGNEANVSFLVRTRAMTGRAVNVRVRLIDENGVLPSREIATRSITASGPDDTVAMEIPIVAPEPGRYQMEVSVDAEEGETLLSNNSQIAFVDVRQGGGRVLYLEGQPRLEQAYLLQSLRRFPDLQITYRWIASDTESKWPIDLGLGQANNAFDVIIIGDLAAAAIGTEQLATIARRVSDGAALMMIGGLKTFAVGGYAASPLADVLPITLDLKLKDFEDDIPLRLANPHPVTSIATPDDNATQQKAWATLPPLIGANQFADLRVAPGIEVLLESVGGDPLLVIGEYGGGRVAAFAGDSTWRWPRRGKSTEHRRFWRQMLLWLLNRDADSTDAFDIQLSRRRAVVGQEIGFIVTGDDGPPGEVAKFEIVAADGTVTAVKPDLVTAATANDPLTIEGTFGSLAPGMYRFRVTPPSNNTNDQQSSIERSFQILDQDAELRQPFADHSYLAQLSAQTAESGGATFLPESVDEMIDLISQLRKNAKAPVVQKYRLIDTPLSAWPLFIVIATLISIEWYLRRRWGLA